MTGAVPPRVTTFFLVDTVPTMCNISVRPCAFTPLGLATPQHSNSLEREYTVRQFSIAPSHVEQVGLSRTQLEIFSQSVRLQKTFLRRNMTLQYYTVLYLKAILRRSNSSIFSTISPLQRSNKSPRRTSAYKALQRSDHSSHRI